MHTNVHVHVVLSNFTHSADIHNFTITNCSIYLTISLSVRQKFNRGADKSHEYAGGKLKAPPPLKNPNDIIIVHVHAPCTCTCTLTVGGSIAC